MVEISKPGIEEEVLSAKEHQENMFLLQLLYTQILSKRFYI